MRETHITEGAQKCDFFHALPAPEIYTAEYIYAAIQFSFPHPHINSLVGRFEYVFLGKARLRYVSENSVSLEMERGAGQRKWRRCRQGQKAACFHSVPKENLPSLSLSEKDHSASASFILPPPINVGFSKVGTEKRKGGEGSMGETLVD